MEAFIWPTQLMNLVDYLFFIETRSFRLFEISAAQLLSDCLSLEQLHVALGIEQVWGKSLCLSMQRKMGLIQMFFFIDLKVMYIERSQSPEPCVKRADPDVKQFPRYWY